MHLKWLLHSGCQYFKCQNKYYFILLNLLLIYLKMLFCLMFKIIDRSWMKQVNNFICSYNTNYIALNDLRGREVNVP